ncbi:restriction endonuclease subunit S [Waltera sp.]|uniref:restriction endonuclease subunit S n=1 Tax=Waltera sp. TaxID=2815806 RepID=UPI003AB933DF
MVSNQKYKPFNVGDIFFITNGKGITRQEIKDHPGELAAIQSAATNNGIMGFIDEDYCRERNYSFTLEPCLTVARTGSSGYVTFQEHGCCVGDSAKLLLLKGKKKTKNIYLYLRTILMANKYRYTFARKVTEENYLNDIIELPINEDDEIDYEYMENYIMQINGDVASIPDYFLQEGYEKACWYLDTIDQDDFEKEYAGKICDDEIVLDTDKWIEFHLYDIFEIHVGNKFDRSKMSMGAPTVNFVGRSSENNGVTAFVDEIEGTEPYKEGNLTVALGGEYLGSCFIQDYPFYTSQNVNVLIPKEDIDIFTKMFIAHLVRYESANNYKAFARELNAHIKTDFVIKLPATVFGKPDYEFMSKYIKSLSFSKKLVQQDNNFCD